MSRPLRIEEIVFSRTSYCSYPSACKKFPASDELGCRVNESINFTDCDESESFLHFYDLKLGWILKRGQMNTSAPLPSSW